MPQQSPSNEKPVLPVSKKERVPGVRPLSRDGAPEDSGFFDGIRIEESVTVGKSANELYAFWRDLSHLTLFCKYLTSVQTLDPEGSRWTIDGPAGKTLSWEAVIVADRPNELIGWRSLEGSEFMNTGSVRFQKAPGDRGTELHLSLAYTPPAGPLGQALAKFTGKDPTWLLKTQLLRFKQLMETGEIATTDGQPSVAD
jgi:uncharacterized membrane protein